MNKEQFEIVRDGILQFNRLVTTPQERKTETYILKCYKLLDDELTELWEEEKGCREMAEEGRGYHFTFKPTEGYLKEVADTVVTGVQLIDAITPSQLEWDYIKPFLSGEVNTCGVTHALLSHVTETILDAEAYGCNVFGAMLSVNDSNLSKVPLLSDVKAQYGCKGYMIGPCDWIETHHRNPDGTQRYHGVHGSVVEDSYGDKRAVFRDETLKVLKPFCYKEADVKPYLPLDKTPAKE